MPKPLADRLTARVEMAFAGKRWQLVFTHRVLLACEDLTGVDMLAANLGNPSAGLLRALLFVALDRAGAPCTIDQVGALITPRSLRRLQTLVLAAWAASMTAPEPGGKRARKHENPKARKPLTWPDAWAEATSRDGLALTEEQWLDMTPRQTGALQKLRMEQMQREEMLVGILGSTIANYGYCRPSKPRTPESFMIHPLPEALEEPLTGEYIQRQMKLGK